jgi:hypothetical protein
VKERECGDAPRPRLERRRQLGDSVRPRRSLARQRIGAAGRLEGQRQRLQPARQRADTPAQLRLGHRERSPRSRASNVPTAISPSSRASGAPMQ